MAFTFFYFFLFFQLSKSIIINYENASVPMRSFQMFSGIAMYSSRDAPSKQFPGNGHSYIKFDLHMERDESSPLGSVELIVMPDINTDDIGYYKNGKLYLCCNDYLIDRNVCTIENTDKLIINKQIKGLYRKDIIFENGSTSTHFETRVPIAVTGYHIFGISSCSDELGTIKFNGTSSWINPYGHLPGDVYGYLPFYAYMFGAYAIVGIIWCLSVFYYRQSIVHLQNCITIVLILCLIEMGTWYFNYWYFNYNGTRHKAPFIIGLLVTVSRRSFSILLTLAVSMGYGVVRTSLEYVKNRLIILGSVYWIFSFLFEALIQYNQTEKEETWMRALLIPPVAFVNGICWWWIFVSLNNTVEILKFRKETEKLQMYRWFTSVLVVALVSAIAFAIYEMYYVLKQLYFAQWERLWFMETGFWQILFTVIFCAIMLLWRPSEHFEKYSVSQQIPQNEDEFIIDNLPKPDTMDDSEEESEIDQQNNIPARFTIDDDEQVNTIKENDNENIKTKDTETEKTSNNDKINPQTDSQTMN